MLATATAIGTTAATSPRNTRTSTISASASPNSSPRARSSSAARLKSSSIESSPTTSVSNPCPPFAASTAATTGSTSRPSSTSSSALWRSRETGPSRTSAAPAARRSLASVRSRASKRGSPAVVRGDDTITVSSTWKPRSARTGGKARSSTCSARCASGRPVKSSSVVRASPSRPAMATADRSTTTTQAPTTAQRWRALTRASRSVTFLSAIASSVLADRIGRRHAPGNGRSPPDGQRDSWPTGWPVSPRTLRAPPRRGVRVARSHRAAGRR